MKKILLSYTLFTLVWIAFFILFNENRMELPVLLRVISIYICLAAALICLIIGIVYLAKKKEGKSTFLLLLLVLLNLLFLSMDPFNIVTGFLG